MAQGKKTRPAKEEAVYAYYVAEQNYSETARKFGLPISTVVGIIDRLKTDTVANVRKAIRADIALECLRAMAPTIAMMKPKFFGNEHVSIASDAAKVLDSLTRSAAAFDPDGDTDAVAPTEIHVHTFMPPPPELAGAMITAATTTTLEKLP